MGGILARQIWGDGFPLNGAQISFFGSISAVLVYAGVSLLTCKQDYNMDALLHRGAYAIEEEKKLETKSAKKVKWGRLIGLDENFSFVDKLLAGGLFAWSMLWLLVLVVGTTWNLIVPWPISVWSSFWRFTAIGLPVFFACGTAVRGGRHRRYAQVFCPPQDRARGPFRQRRGGGIPRASGNGKNDSRKIADPEMTRLVGLRGRIPIADIVRRIGLAIGTV